MSVKKPRKRKASTKAYKSVEEMPKIDEMVKNFSKKGLKDALEPEKIKEMIEQFTKEHMNGIISDLVGPDGGTIKEMLEQQTPERPNLNPNRFNNPGNVGAISGGGRNQGRMGAGGQQNQQRKQIEELAGKATTITCSNCSGHFFNTAFIIKRVSPIVSPSGEEMIIPIQTFRCVGCNSVNSDFLPPNILNDVEKAVQED